MEKYNENDTAPAFKHMSVTFETNITCDNVWLSRLICRFMFFHFIPFIQLHKTQDTCKYSSYKYIDKVNTIKNTWAKDIMHMEVFGT